MGYISEYLMNPEVADAESVQDTVQKKEEDVALYYRDISRALRSKIRDLKKVRKDFVEGRASIKDVMDRKADIWNLQKNLEFAQEELQCATDKSDSEILSVDVNSSEQKS